MHNSKGAIQNDYLVVLIDESGAKLRGECYRKIWRHINLNDSLRRLLTGSTNRVSLSQVVDMAGFGVITTTPPLAGHYVILEFHPRIDGKIQAVGTKLGQCGLGCVVQQSAA